jgi:hypothetical protein
MSVISAAAITALAKVFSPVINDLYAGAKGSVKKNLEKWSALNGVKGMTRVLVKVESVKTIWSPDKELLLSDFYYPSKALVMGAGRHIKSIDGINALPEGNVIIQGTVGQGKSIFMRYLASSAIRSEEVKCIPVFLEFRNFSTKRSLTIAVQKYLESIGVVYSEETFSYLAASGRLVILLDGFDELAEDCVVETIQEIEYLQTKFPETKIIISSRPQNEIQKVGGFSQVNLRPLNNNDYDPFLKRLNIATVKRVELIDAIAGSPSNISGIIQTPLMLTLVVMVYQSERIIPPTLAEFFESLFQVVFTKHDRLKAGFYRKHHSGLSERKLQRLFEAFCFMVIQMGYGRTLKDDQFNSAFEYAQDYADGCVCDVDNFRKDIVKVACLMLEEGLGLTTFLHKSILDYHAAAFIKNSSEEVTKLFYESTTNGAYKRWKSVLQFLESIDSYRYSKDYVISALPVVLGSLEILLRERSDTSLLAYIDSRHPDFTVAYHTDYMPDSFGPMAAEKGIWDDYIDMAIFGAITDVVDAPEGQQLIKEIYGEFATEARQGKEAKFLLNTDKYLSLFGSAAIWKALSEVETTLRHMLDVAELAVQAQDRKKLIFERKPKIGS